jgi:perosamine synthetase
MVPRAKSLGTRNEVSWMIPVHEPDLGAAELAALGRCISVADAGGHSPTTESFEAEFALRVQSSHAVATSSGTAALHLAFAALGVGPGDEVIVPSFTFAPCADMVALTGATPVFVDSDPRTFNLSCADVRRTVTAATKAVLAVHLYGRPCTLTLLSELCRERGVALVEDCAQGLGAEHAGRPVGSFGALACYSFYANKVITTGEGGMVTTEDETLADRLRWLRSHAQVADDERAYLHTAVGFNYRMSAFNAAVGRAQLERLDEFLARKAGNAAHYSTRLADCPGVRVPADTPPPDRHANWAYTIVVDAGVVVGGAGGLAAFLRARGYETRRFYHPLHLHPVTAAGGSARRKLPGCETFAPTGLVLPSGNTLQPSQVEAIAAAIRSYVGA